MITAYFAVMFPVMLMFIALSLDYGRAYVLRHQLQAACDAASLAGSSAVSAKLITDGVGEVTNKKILLDPVIAEARAVDVWNQNVSSMKFASKGVTIVDTSNHCSIDQDSDGYLDAYKWGVTAQIKSYIAGPVSGAGNQITVTRVAISRSREPNP